MRTPTSWTALFGKYPLLAVCINCMLKLSLLSKIVRTDQTVNFLFIRLDSMTNKHQPFDKLHFSSYWSMPCTRNWFTNSWANKKLTSLPSYPIPELEALISYHQGSAQNIMILTNSLIETFVVGGDRMAPNPTPPNRNASLTKAI